MTLGRDLAYVALVARDTDLAARVLGRELGLRRSDLDDGFGHRMPVFSVGESAVALFPPGHPGVGGETRPGVHHIALGVEHLDSGLEAAGKAGMRSTGKPETGLGGRRRIALALEGTANVRTWITERIDIDRAKAPLIERLDHLGIASADNQAGIAAWSHRLGCPIESQQTDMEVMIPVESFTSDKHGVFYHTRAPIPIGGLRVAFIRVGDTELEFLQNFDPRQKGVVEHGSSGTTRQDQGAIAKFVAARGPGLHHVAMKTPDINAVLRGLDAAGVSVIDKTGRPGSRAGLIGFVHPRGTGGILLHFDERPQTVLVLHGYDPAKASLPEGSAHDPPIVLRDSLSDFSPAVPGKKGRRAPGKSPCTKADLPMVGSGRALRHQMASTSCGGR